MTYSNNGPCYRAFLDAIKGDPTTNWECWQRAWQAAGGADDPKPEHPSVAAFMAWLREHQPHPSLLDAFCGGWDARGPSLSETYEEAIQRLLALALDAANTFTSRIDSRDTAGQNHVPLERETPGASVWAM